MGEAKRRGLHPHHNQPFEGEPPDIYGQEYFHVAHACGHSVFWNNGIFAMLASRWPCPWCGAETGLKAAPEAWAVVGITGDRQQERLACVRSKSPDGTFGGPGGDRGEPIVIRHMTGDVCCLNPPPLSN